MKKQLIIILSLLAVMFLVVGCGKPLAGKAFADATGAPAACDVSGSLEEGEAQTYTLAGKNYDVSLGFVDATTAKFSVNGEENSE